MAAVASVLRSKPDLEKFLQTLEETTATKYIVHSCDKNFLDAAWQPTQRMRVRWEWSQESGTASIPFDGLPFIFIGYQYFGCHQGRDKAKQKKLKYAEAKEKEYNQKNRRLVQNTKKVGCPAVLNISRIAKFPGYKLEENKEHQRRKMVTSLKEALEKDPSSVLWENLYYVRTPVIQDHVGHPVYGQGAVVREPVDERVKNHIIELSRGRVREVSEVRWHSKQFVERHLFKDQRPPSPSRRRFYPTDKDIRNLVQKAEESGGSSGTDQENLQLFYPLPPAEEKADITLDPPKRKKGQTDVLKKECTRHLKSIMDYVKLLKDDTYLKELRGNIKDMHDQVVSQVPEVQVRLLQKASKKRKTIPSDAMPLPKQPKQHTDTNGVNVGSLQKRNRNSVKANTKL
ncbi:uncharacterized protein si:dkey-31c13.1 [Centropristis striata]|uniref:uncharacterized protein si:dkey-31c13.1 n=1 Tax=Centropristis striata TaxID=184440 RepID=UPI0027E1F3CE|nr:uncharacterized protein si:dkey-31c13.1 [Centropristis striata]